MIPSQLPSSQPSQGPSSQPSQFPTSAPSNLPTGLGRRRELDVQVAVDDGSNQRVMAQKRGEKGNILSLKTEEEKGRGNTERIPGEKERIATSNSQIDDHPQESQRSQQRKSEKVDNMKLPSLSSSSSSSSAASAVSPSGSSVLSVIRSFFHCLFGRAR